MTELLERAFAELAQLPSVAQDAIASRILAEIDDEAAWSSRFAATTEDQWASLADMARREIAAGDVSSLDDVFPPEPFEA